MIRTTVTLELTSDDAMGDELAERIKRVLQAAHGSASEQVSPLTGDAALAVETGRERLELPELREVMIKFVDGTLGSPLNEGEKSMLRGIARAAPAPLSYDDNRALLGSGAKFGNVSSGLARRFARRGFELPYAPDSEHVGYCMAPDVARMVLELLGSED